MNDHASPPRFQAPSLFRAVDRAMFAAAFCRKLQAAGVATATGDAERLVKAMEAVRPSDRSTFYWVARASVVHDVHDYPLFDEVFAAAFDSEGLPTAPRARDHGTVRIESTGMVTTQSAPTDGFAIAAGRVTSAAAPEILDDAADEESLDPRELIEKLPAVLAAVADRPFDQLDEATLDAIGEWLAPSLVALPRRKSRRQERTRSGRSVDLRRTLAAARSTGGFPVAIARRRQRERPRRVVMLCDVSGSMESYVRIYLHLMRSLVVHADAEVFTVGTEANRATVALRGRDHRQAIDEICQLAADRFGGTRLASSIDTLTRSPIWSPLFRGAVVLIASDGLDADDPSEMSAAMKRLSRFAHHIIWINPRASAADYEPAAGSMAAALAHIDDFRSGRTLRHLTTLFAS